MTTREQIIAAAKEAEFGTLTPYGEECAERFYTIAFEAGAASRDAEIQRLQFALADSEALELGTAERCDQLRAELEYDQRNAAMSQSESARLLDENTKLRAELVKALAACKAKDEALNTIVTVFYPKGIWKQAREALAIQPDDSALKAWLGKPVAWLHEKRTDSDVITDAVKNVWNGVVVGKDAAYSIPLYSPKGLVEK